MKISSRYLPLFLLMSVHAYSMDNGIEPRSEISDEVEEPVTMSMPEKKAAVAIVLSESAKGLELAPKLVEPVVAVAAVASTIGLPMAAEKKEVAAQRTVAQPMSASGKNSRGFWTHLKYGVYGSGAMLTSELEDEKNVFDANNMENRQNIYGVLTHLSSDKTVDKLIEIDRIFTASKKRKLKIDDVAVLQRVREYVSYRRDLQETALTSDVGRTTEESNKSREVRQTEVQETIKKNKDIIEQTKKNNGVRQEEAFKTHVPNIALATKIKRATRDVNDHLPADGYDSDAETTYDTNFIAHKLELDDQIAQDNRTNERTISNLETLFELTKDITTKRLKTAQSEFEDIV